MTPRTLWILLLRIFGLYILFQVFSVASYYLSSLSFLFLQGGEGVSITVGILLLTIGIYVLLINVFFFKTEWLINKLQLDKGITEERIVENIHWSTILQVATIVTGALTFIDSLTHLVQNLLTYAQQQRGYVDVGNNSATPWIIFYFIKAIVGYLLATNSRQVVNWIEKQRRKA